MNSQHPPEDKHSLESLYQARKQRHPAPLSDKEAILEHAKTLQKQTMLNSVIDALKAHIKVSAVYASLAIVVVVVVGMQSMQNKRLAAGGEPFIVQYTTVQMHSLESEQLASAETANTLFQYNKARHDMLMNQAMQIEHQQVLRVISSDDGLQLVSCKDELLEISSQALAMLISDGPAESIPKGADFTEGQLLAISFDANGYILHIDPTEQSKQCT